MPVSIKHLSNIHIINDEATCVLAKWTDGLYYKVNVRECNKKKRKCQVEFEDGYKCWMDAIDLHAQLDLDNIKDSDIVCCICDLGHDVPDNKLVLCDICQQGYHSKCHQPNITEDFVDDDETDWFCKTCESLPAQGGAKTKPEPIINKRTKPKSVPYATEAVPVKAYLAKVDTTGQARDKKPAIIKPSFIKSPLEDMTTDYDMSMNIEEDKTFSVEEMQSEVIETCLELEQTGFDNTTKEFVKMVMEEPAKEVVDAPPKTLKRTTKSRKSKKTPAA